MICNNLQTIDVYGSYRVDCWRPRRSKPARRQPQTGVAPKPNRCQLFDKPSPLPFWPFQALDRNTYESSFVQAKSKFLPIPSPGPAKQTQARPKNKILPVLPLPSGAPQGAPSFFDDRAKVKRIPIFTKELFEKFVASSSAFLRPIDPGGSEVGNTYRCLDAQSLFRLSPNVHIALRLNVRRVAPRLDVLGRRFLFRSRFCLLEERFRPRRYDCRHNRGSDAAKNQLPILRGSYKIIWMS